MSTRRAFLSGTRVRLCIASSLASVRFFILSFTVRELADVDFALAVVQGGDYTLRNGKGGESIYGEPFDDENLKREIDAEG